ncbi:acyltransferase [Halomonas sp. 7T]|uniref:acyltransferase family protein n=1 Tax=Halomonas sp. 7T TaxID=2893469 RepID=UPI0021D98FFF|nr:acyltransferase [Halomonas sp. 7T]UXZ55065.1 acyltransferase [Halomonas sp. 7T]
MGVLRFALALLVLLSHMHIYVAGLNLGVSAVVVFYLLAGHVVCRLWERLAFQRVSDKLRWFYRDRVWRIAPLYGYALLISLLAWALGAESYFISEGLSMLALVQNVLIVPLNYYMVSGIDRFTLLPPAWSLAVELQFYLLVPLLLVRWQFAALAAALSIGVFVLAQLPLLNTDIFGYRLLPGVLFIFVVGGVWQSRDLAASLTQVKSLLLFSLWAVITAYTGWLFMHVEWRAPYNLEVALGFAVGFPLLVLFSRLRVAPWLHIVQRLLGALSYGVFLLHFPAMWLLALFRPGLEHSVVAVVALTTCLAIIGHFCVERPLWQRYRQMLT